MINKEYAYLFIYLLQCFFLFSTAHAHETTRKIDTFTLTADEKLWLQKKNFTLKFGINPTWPPIDFVNEKGEHIGLVADYIRLFSESTGVKIEYSTSLTWMEHLEKLQRNEVDFIGSIHYTKERASFLHFTDVYLKLPNLLVTNTTYIKSKKPLEKAHFALVQGYSYISELQKRYPEATFSYFNRDINALLSTSAGLTDICILDMPTINYLVKTYQIPNVEVYSDANLTWELRMASNEANPELAKLLNRFIHSLPETLHNELINRHLNYSELNPTGNLKQILAWVLISVIILLLGILLSFNYSRQLQKQVNERTQVVKQLNEKYSIILQVTTDCLFEFDFIAGRIRFETGIEQLFEHVIPKNELTVVQLKSYIHPEDVPEFEKKFQQVLVVPTRQWFCTFRITTQTEQTKWLSLNSSLVYENGKAIKATGAIKDVSESVRSQKALEIEQKNTEALINNTDDLIWSIRKDYTLLSANKRYYEEMYRHSRIQFKPGDSIKPLFDMLPKEMKQEWYSLFSQALSGKTYKTEVYIPQLGENEEKWAELTFTPIVEKDEIMGIAIQFHDITEKNEHLMAIEKQNSLLKEIAWIQSHVVRAPLARLLTVLSLFKEDESCLSLPTLLSIIEEAAQELDEIITDISNKSDTITNSIK